MMKMLQQCSMNTYFDSINNRAKELEVPLLDAFKEADLPTSTYYRAFHGKTELRYLTAIKVMNAIERLYSNEQCRAYTKGLREANISIDPRTVRAKFKPRGTSA